MADASPTPPSDERIPVALTIAGSDSSGGAGIQADLKTFAALGVYGASVVTALTAQNTLGVGAVHDAPETIVAAQLDAVFGDLAIRSTKIGMLSRAETVAVVADGLVRHAARNIVLDPVMVATSGAVLITADAAALLRTRLLPLADLITPNLPEAAALLGCPMAQDEAEMRAQAERLLRLGPGAVLVKGGHGAGQESVDVLVDGHGLRRYAAPRIQTRNTHGTGCTLSAAIAAGLANGLDLRCAIAEAKAYLTAALAAGAGLRLGAGSGPVQHFFMSARERQA